MGVFEKGIPEKLSEYAIMIPEETDDFRIQDAIFLELSGRGDTERAPEGRRALSATRFIESSPASLPDDGLQRIASDLMKNMEGMLPFLQENIEFIDIQRCVELSKTCVEAAGCKFSIRRKILPGLDFMTNRTPLRNVFMTGDELFGMGFVGEVLSGLNAASLVCGGRRR